MDELGLHPFIRVKTKNLRLVQENADKIHDLFSVRVCERTVTKQNVSKSGFVLLSVEHDNSQENASSLTDLVSQIQRFVDNLCTWERDGDDSSYDSDYEDSGIASHHDVSRTVSDTLGAEFAEYVSERALPPPAAAAAAAAAAAGPGTKYVLGGPIGSDYFSERPNVGAEYTPERLATDSIIEKPAGYIARVEFGLKLGYTEKLVQAALQKLGPEPGQNELLQELVKLGAQVPRVQDPSSADDAPPDRPPEEQPAALLRPVVIDGSNVAMSHGNKEVFSCRGIKICVDWFRARGHREITVFVPKWRKESARPDNPITDQETMMELERERCLVFTPSRLVGGKRMVCYDDRYILQLAADNEGIVVSNDNYRDLVQEKPEFRKVVEERILMYSFVNDRFMPPDDPLGRSGPTLDNFLLMGSKRGDAPPPCPYAKKCTYGNKCKFHHPERTTPLKSVTDRLLENAQRQLHARGNPAQKSVSLPLPPDGSAESVRKQPLSRTKSNAPTFSGGDELRDKSRSVENVAGCFRTPPPGYSTGWPRTPDQPVAPWPTQPFEAPAAPDGSCTNLHRKLQRQLTLNPSSDPRLHRYMQQHRPVARHVSDSAQAPWDRHTQAHPSVTRIASAPPPHTSEPQLWPPQMMWAPPPVQYTHSSEDARRKLYFHLASIFPEEQVVQAMQQWPDETNPQKICAAILSMFPKT